MRLQYFEHADQRASAIPAVQHDHGDGLAHRQHLLRLSADESNEAYVEGAAGEPVVYVLEGTDIDAPGYFQSGELHKEHSVHRPAARSRDQLPVPNADVFHQPPGGSDHEGLAIRFVPAICERRAADTSGSDHDEQPARWKRDVQNGPAPLP